jgi:hypothetical protein
MEQKWNVQIGVVVKIMSTQKIKPLHNMLVPTILDLIKWVLSMGIGLNHGHVVEELGQIQVVLKDSIEVK